MTRYTIKQQSTPGVGWSIISFLAIIGLLAQVSEDLALGATLGLLMLFVAYVMLGKVNRHGR